MFLDGVDVAVLWRPAQSDEPGRIFSTMHEPGHDPSLRIAVRSDVDCANLVERLGGIHGSGSAELMLAPLSIGRQDRR